MRTQNTNDPHFSQGSIKSQMTPRKDSHALNVAGIMELVYMSVTCMCTDAKRSTCFQQQKSVRQMQTLLTYEWLSFTT